MIMLKSNPEFKELVDLVAKECKGEDYIEPQVRSMHTMTVYAAVCGLDITEYISELLSKLKHTYSQDQMYWAPERFKTAASHSARLVFDALRNKKKIDDEQIVENDSQKIKNLTN